MTPETPAVATVATDADLHKRALRAMDGEITRLRRERDELRTALLDALVVFDIGTNTDFRKHYAALIEHAQRKVA